MIHLTSLYRLIKTDPFTGMIHAVSNVSCHTRQAPATWPCLLRAPPRSAPPLVSVVLLAFSQTSAASVRSLAPARRRSTGARQRSNSHAAPRSCIADPTAMAALNARLAPALAVRAPATRCQTKQEHFTAPTMASGISLRSRFLSAGVDSVGTKDFLQGAGEACFTVLSFASLLQRIIESRK